MNRFRATTLVVLFSVVTAFPKNERPITILWPQEKPALKLVFDRFREQGNYSGQNSYSTDVTVQNLTDKQLPRVIFTVYLIDKDRVRIGEGTLQVADLEAGQSAKINFQFYTTGIPVNLTLSPESGVKTVSVKIISIPPGAQLIVDGQQRGVTPVLVRLPAGTHQLDLKKEGYAPGATPLEVTPDELPGGRVTIELGGLSRDTVELRDGTMILGDVISMSMTEIVVRADGKDKTYPRNQVKKMILVERVIDQQPGIVQPAPITKPQ